jgi:3-oxoacyl-[acyl-carrier protein] reductase
MELGAKGRAAAITGGSKGIGRAIARAVAAEGVNLVSGHVVNLRGVAHTLVFGAALTHGLNNAAMNQVTNYLANDFAGGKITVNAPGKTKAEFPADFCRRTGIIAGRFATMERVASSVVFLASGRGRYINGPQFVIDGGMSINPRHA